MMVVTNFFPSQNISYSAEKLIGLDLKLPEKQKDECLCKNVERSFGTRKMTQSKLLTLSWVTFGWAIWKGLTPLGEVLIEAGEVERWKLSKSVKEMMIKESGATA